MQRLPPSITKGLKHVLAKSLQCSKLLLGSHLIDDALPLCGLALTEFLESEVLCQVCNHSLNVLHQQRPEDRSQLDEEPADDSSEDVSPVEASGVDELFEDREDEQRNESCYRVESQPPRGVELLNDERNGDECRSKPTDAEVSPLVHSPLGEDSLKQVLHCLLMLMVLLSVRQSLRTRQGSPNGVHRA